MTDIPKNYSSHEIQAAITDTIEGNTKSFGIIYDAYYKMIFSIIRRIVKPAPHEMNDIINESFFLVYKGLKYFKGESKFSTYVYRIVLNYAFKASKKKRLKEKKTILLDSDEDNAIEQIAGPTMIDIEVVNRTIVENAIQTLDKELQNAVHLYYYKSYSVKEISKIMNCTESMTKNRLFSARNKIKKKLSKGGII